MNNRIRQIAVIVFALLDIISSFWLGDSLNQGEPGAVEVPIYFLPANLTFAIWGLIFSSQLVYGIYQALPSQTERVLHKRIGWWVALNAALTALWNFTAGNSGQQGDPNFQPLLVVATVFILMGMLFALTRVFIIFRELYSDFAPIDRWLVQFPITIFFAWLNVAMIANSAAALVAVGYTGEPNGEIWATGMLIIAMMLASLMIFYTRPGLITITYTGVIIWAAIGILVNNINRSSLVSGACIALIIVVTTATITHFRTQTKLTNKNLHPARVA
ncbi:MAG: hypothetical protein SFZ02_04655 [bacterium]|nr:hypothetical protein [bacterium]